MGPVATRLRLPVQAQDGVLAVSVALFQLLGTYRATGNQPGTRPLGDPDGLSYLLLTVGGRDAGERPFLVPWTLHPLGEGPSRFKWSAPD